MIAFVIKLIYYTIRHIILKIIYFMCDAIDTPVKEEPHKSIICSKCKTDSGILCTDLLDIVINDDIKCEACGDVLVSCRPEVKPPYVYVSSAAPANGNDDSWRWEGYGG